MLMKDISRRLRLLSILSIVAFFSGCQSPIVIEQSTLSTWFWRQLLLVVSVTFVLGVVAARSFCRLPIRAPRLDCIRAARRRFAQWGVVLALFITPAWLWFYAVMTQPFGEGNQLSPVGVFLLVTLDWRTVVLMLVVAVVFFLTVGLFTRVIFGATCNCRYAFIPKSSS